MNKEWDSARGGRDAWVAWLAERLAQCYRVLKPGGHILVWAIPRTSHWTGLAIEDAGFEIRDRVSHLFGTGFPKGGKISKAIDKKLGVEPTIIGDNPNHRPVSGVEYEGIYQGGNTGSKHLTAPTSLEAKQWAGWALALKPACEDWWLARKPFKGALVNNVLKNGVGCLNVDACRIGDRWPAHVVLSHHPDCKVVGTKIEKGHKGYPNGPGGKSVHWYEGSKRSDECRTEPWEGIPDREVPAYDCHPDCPVGQLDEASAGEGASRFFYCAKPTKKERNDGVKKGSNNHPTVKAVELMRWLIRLITPPGGLVLDPFTGSGTTGVASVQEGFRFLGVEENADYMRIAQQRIQAAAG